MAEKEPEKKLDEEETADVEEKSASTEKEIETKKDTDDSKEDETLDTQKDKKDKIIENNTDNKDNISKDNVDKKQTDEAKPDKAQEDNADKQNTEGTDKLDNRAGEDNRVEAKGDAETQTVKSTEADTPVKTDKSMETDKGEKVVVKLNKETVKGAEEGSATDEGGKEKATAQKLKTKIVERPLTEVKEDNLRTEQEFRVLQEDWSELQTALSDQRLKIPRLRAIKYARLVSAPELTVYYAGTLLVREKRERSWKPRHVIILEREVHLLDAIHSKQPLHVLEINSKLNVLPLDMPIKPGLDRQCMELAQTKTKLVFRLAAQTEGAGDEDDFYSALKQRMQALRYRGTIPEGVKPNRSLVKFLSKRFTLPVDFQFVLGSKEVDISDASFKALVAILGDRWCQSIAGLNLSKTKLLQSQAHAVAQALILRDSSADSCPTHKLDVSNNKLFAVSSTTPNPTEWLATVLRIPCLKELNVAETGLAFAHLAQLSDTLTELGGIMAPLQKLVISGNPLVSGPKGLGVQELLSILRNVSIRHLRVFELSGCSLQDKAAKALAELLRTSVSLQVLDLTDNLITDKGVGYLAEAALSSPSLRQLLLTNNPFGNKAEATLAHMAQKHETLEALHFGRHKLDSEGLSMLRLARQAAGAHE